MTGIEAVGNRHSSRWETEVFIFQASSRSELLQSASTLANSPGIESAELKNVALTLHTQEQRAVRLAIVASSVEELRLHVEHACRKLADPACRRIRDARGIYYFEDPLAVNGRIAFLFPGEGAQYSHMLADVCMHFPEARAWFDLMDRAFFDHPRGYLPSELVFPAAKTTAAEEGRMWDMDGAVETVFAANQGLFSILKQLGIRPDMIAGHSSGDYSALLAAGCIGSEGEEEVLKIIRDLNAVYEGFAANGNVPKATLLAVSAVQRDVLDRIVSARPGAITVALDNCPQQIVLCGDEAAINRAAALLHNEGAITEPLPFARPYHTPLFTAFSSRLREFFRDIRIASPVVDVYSCATAARYPSDPDHLREIAVEQWTRPVRFRETIEAMYDAGARVFVEVGPRGNLTGFVENILRGRPAVAVPMNTTQRTGIAQLNHAIAILAAHGVRYNAAGMYRWRGARGVALTGQEEKGKRAATIELALRLPRLQLSAADRPTRTAPPASSAPGAQPGPRARAMEAYLGTMEQFLGVERQVMRAALGRSAEIAAPDAGSEQRPPFVDYVVSLDPGKAVVATCELDLQRHRFMRDHTLGGAVSAWDPDLTGLPVVPLAVSVEMLAEVASLIRPGLVATALREVRAHRWIVMESERLTLRFSATALSGCEVRVEMSEDDGTGDRPAAVEAVVEFADRRLPTVRAGESPLKHDRRSKWPEGDMYGHTGMFHGPSFQLVIRMDRSAEDGAEATFAGRDYRSWIRNCPRAGFLLDPAVLDAMGQVVGYWVGDRFETGLSVFPFRLERLDFFLSLPAGAEARCRVRVTHADDDWIRSNIDVVAENGAVMARMLQWEDRRLDLPRRIYDFRIAPHTVMLSDEESDARRGRACRFQIPRSVLQAHGAIWLRVLAFLVLSGAERRQWRKVLAESMDAALDWLAVRIVAKDAVRLLLAPQRSGLYPADIEIHGDGGDYLVRGPWNDGNDDMPAISVTRSGQGVAAVASYSRAVVA